MGVWESYNPNLPDGLSVTAPSVLIGILCCQKAGSEDDDRWLM